jgi:hypothetical protein
VTEVAETKPEKKLHELPIGEDDIPASSNGNGNGAHAASSNGNGASAAAAAAAPKQEPSPEAILGAAAAAAAATFPPPAAAAAAAATATSSSDEEMEPAAAGQLEMAAGVAGASSEQAAAKPKLSAAGTPYANPGGRWSQFKSYSTFQRTLQIWTFAIQFAFKYLLLNQKWTYGKGGMTAAAVSAKKSSLAVWLREGLVRLGPTFIKIGQQFSTRVDVLSKVRRGGRVGREGRGAGGCSAARRRCTAAASLPRPPTSPTPPTHLPAPPTTHRRSSSRSWRSCRTTCLPLTARPRRPSSSATWASPPPRCSPTSRSSPSPPRRWARCAPRRASRRASRRAALRPALLEPIRCPLPTPRQRPAAQVHLAEVDGQKVVVKVQRPGLKDLFDIDLQNIRALAVWLQKVDPKTDGAARDWVAIYDECSRILYQEIDYKWVAGAGAGRWSGAWGAWVMRVGLGGEVRRGCRRCRGHGRPPAGLGQGARRRAGPLTPCSPARCPLPPRARAGWRAATRTPSARTSRARRGSRCPRCCGTTAAARCWCSSTCRVGGAPGPDPARPDPHRLRALAQRARCGSRRHPQRPRPGAPWQPPGARAACRPHSAATHSAPPPRPPPPPPPQARRSTTRRPSTPWAWTARAWRAWPWSRTCSRSCATASSTRTRTRATWPWTTVRGAAPAPAPAHARPPARLRWPPACLGPRRPQAQAPLPQTRSRLTHPAGAEGGRLIYYGEAHAACAQLALAARGLLAQQRSLAQPAR